MKNNLKKLYHNYLKDIGQLPDTSFGEDQKIELNITRGQNDFFVKQIYEQGKVNDKIIVFAIILLIFILLAGLSITFYYQNQPLLIASIFVFTITAVFIILFQLKRFWLEKPL